MTNYPTGQQTSAVYTLTDSTGYEAVFNDETDAAYIGVTGGDDAITGLDSPEVRVNVADLVEADGAVIGATYHGARPITMQAQILAATKTARNLRESRLRRVLNFCTRAPGTLTWTPEGGIEQFVNVQKHQATRIRGGWMKESFIGLIAADPRIYSTAERSLMAQTPNADHTAENQGDWYTPPSTMRVRGPGTTPTVRRVWDGGTIDLVFTGLTLIGGEYIDLDFMDKTVTKSTGENLYDFLDTDLSYWWELGPGNNTVRVNWASGSSGASTYDLYWRDTWL